MPAPQPRPTPLARPAPVPRPTPIAQTTVALRVVQARRPVPRPVSVPTPSAPTPSAPTPVPVAGSEPTAEIRQVRPTGQADADLRTSPVVLVKRPRAAPVLDGGQHRKPERTTGRHAIDDGGRELQVVNGW